MRGEGGSAILSPCGTYRMTLGRDLGQPGLVGVTVGVNPSTADAEDDDQTIRKDMGFGRLLGWSRLIKVNKFAYRATDVRELAKAVDPIGPDNDRYIEAAFREADVILFAYGPLAKLPKYLRRRWLEVARIADRVGKPVHCLGTAKDGHPRHTLMLPYSTPLTIWTRP